VVEEEERENERGAESGEMEGIETLVFMLSLRGEEVDELNVEVDTGVDLEMGAGVGAAVAAAV
jgi:hypothetical protein